MTVETNLVARLMENGLWQEQAEAVVSLMKTKPEHKAVGWNYDVDQYSEVLHKALWLNARRNALEWLKEHAPLHWAIAVFK